MIYLYHDSDLLSSGFTILPTFSVLELWIILPFWAQMRDAGVTYQYQVYCGGLSVFSAFSVVIGSLSLDCTVVYFMLCCTDMTTVLSFRPCNDDRNLFQPLALHCFAVIIAFAPKGVAGKLTHCWWANRVLNGIAVWSNQKRDCENPFLICRNPCPSLKRNKAILYSRTFLWKTAAHLQIYTYALHKIK